MVEEDELQKARDFALNYLSYRSRSSKEVYDRLRRKGYTERIAGQVVEYLTGRRYLDDRKFAHDWARFLVDRKMVGKIFLRQELHLKGISEDIIKEVIGEVYESEDRERELALQLLQRRAARYHKKGEEKLRRSLANLLLRHGFSRSIIWKVLPEGLRAVNGSEG